MEEKEQNRQQQAVMQESFDENGVKHEGGRGRNVLLDFLGDAKIKSLQSDGYNVYTYS